MFIECTSDSGFEDQLTESLLYKVKDLGENSYQITNDQGVLRYYGTIHFEVSKVNL